MVTHLDIVSFYKRKHLVKIPLRPNSNAKAKMVTQVVQ